MALNRKLILLLEFLLVIAFVVAVRHERQFTGDTDICSQPMEIGFCKALKPRFYFNAESGACELFNYGGCHGNDNNFMTLDDCEATCLN